MKNMVRLFGMLLALLVLSSTTQAQALPSWCYDYTSYDSFNGWGNWGLWNVSVSGVTKVGTTGSNKSPPGAVLMSFADRESNGNFMALDRYFTLAGDANSRYDACRGRTSSGPFSQQSSNAKFCSAEVSVRTSQGAHVAIVLLDPDYFIMSQKEIDLPKSTAWTRIWTPEVLNCRQDVVVRLALVKTATSASVQFDDFRMDWWY